MKETTVFRSAISAGVMNEAAISKTSHDTLLHFDITERLVEEGVANCNHTNVTLLNIRSHKTKRSIKARLRRGFYTSWDD